MNKVIENIKTRRSVRKYKAEQVPDELLQQVLECGRSAPSGRGSHSCHFLVVQNEKILQELQDLVHNIFNDTSYDEVAYQNMLPAIKAAENGFTYGAPTLIIVASKKGYGNELSDAACAIENMMLAAHSLGLGSCWVNQLRWLRDDECLKPQLWQLGLKTDEIVCGSLVLGYPVNAPAATRTITGNPVTFVQ